MHADIQHALLQASSSPPRAKPAPVQNEPVRFPSAVAQLPDTEQHAQRADTQDSETLPLPPDVVVTSQHGSTRQASSKRSGSRHEDNASACSDSSSLGMEQSKMTANSDDNETKHVSTVWSDQVFYNAGGISFARSTSESAWMRSSAAGGGATGAGQTFPAQPEQTLGLGNGNDNARDSVRKAPEQLVLECLAKSRNAAEQAAGAGSSSLGSLAVSPRAPGAAGTASMRLDPSTAMPGVKATNREDTCSVPVASSAHVDNTGAVSQSAPLPANACATSEALDLPHASASEALTTDDVMPGDAGGKGWQRRRQPADVRNPEWTATFRGQPKGAMASRYMHASICFPHNIVLTAALHEYLKYAAGTSV